MSRGVAGAVGGGRARIACNRLPTTFLAFGLLTVASRHLAPWLRQERWRWPVNVTVNVGFVLLSFDLGFRADRWLC